MAGTIGITLSNYNYLRTTLSGQFPFLPGPYANRNIAPLEKERRQPKRRQDDQQKRDDSAAILPIEQGIGRRIEVVE
jgi:hypothetical protein